MAGKKQPGKKPKDKPEKAPEEKKHKKLAVALIIAAVLVLAFALPLIVGAIFLFVGYNDESPTLIALGEIEISYFAFLTAVFLIVLIAVILILLRDMVHAADDDRKKKKPESKIKRPKKELDLYEEKPEYRRSFGS